MHPERDPRRWPRRNLGVMRFPLAVVAFLVLAFVAASVSPRAAPITSAVRPIVPCDEIILDTKFPYRTGAYRQVLGAVAVPPSYLRQVVPTHSKPWAYWRKAGLVVRAGSPQITVTVPTRLAQPSSDHLGQRECRTRLGESGDCQLSRHGNCRTRLRGRLLSPLRFGVRADRLPSREATGDHSLWHRSTLLNGAAPERELGWASVRKCPLRGMSRWCGPQPCPLSAQQRKFLTTAWTVAGAVGGAAVALGSITSRRKRRLVGLGDLRSGRNRTGRARRKSLRTQRT